MKSRPERGHTGCFLILVLVCFLIVTVGILPHEQATAVEPPAPEVLYYYANMPNWVDVISNGCPAGYDGPYVASGVKPNSTPPGYDVACARCPAGKGLYSVQPYGSHTAQFMCSCGTNVWNGQTCVRPTSSTSPISSTPPICTANTVEIVEYCSDGTTWKTRRTCSADGYSWNYQTNPEPCPSAVTVTGNLTVIKKIVNDNAGTATLDSFTPLMVNSTVVTNGTSTEFNAGTYIVSETTQPGYSAEFGGACDSGGKVTLGVGDDVTCTITNDDVQPKLTVIKKIINDNGGTAGLADFTLMVDSTTVENNTATGVNLGTHTVGETGSALSGYTATFSGDCNPSTHQVTLALGESKTCTITNDDQPGVLKVVKVLTNDNGGEKTLADFTIHVSGVKVNNTSPAASASGVFISLDQGDYSVTEDTVTGYETTLSADCSGHMNIGDSKTCTITNDDVQPKLTVIKKIKNDNGGSATLAGFLPLKVGTVEVTNNSATGFDSGTYVVSEASVKGYTATFSGACDGSDQVTLSVGDDVTCTITNDDIQPQLIVKKHVVTDNGGTNAASDWTMSVTGSSPSPSSFPGDESGTTVTLNVGSYNVTESGPAGYVVSRSADCEGSMLPGDVKTCTITNDDVPPCIVCDGETIEVNEDVTVDFNPTVPTCYDGTTGGLCTFFSYDKSGGSTADKWKAVFDLGAKRLLIKDNATITVTDVPSTGNNRRSPGIEFRSTCELEIEADKDGNGVPGQIVVDSESQPAGGISIQVAGDIVINGTVRNAVGGSGPSGFPGNITIASRCGDIMTGPMSKIETIGQDSGGSDINLLTCIEGDIEINGLVHAQHKYGVTPAINIVALKGAVTIDGNNDFGEENEGGTAVRRTSGVLVRTLKATSAGTINIQAKNDITVLGNYIFNKNRNQYGAVAVKPHSTNGLGGDGDITVVSLDGRIIASDRAFDFENRFNRFNKITLLAKGNIELSVTARKNDGASDNSKAVVSTQGGDTEAVGNGGTNTLRSYGGSIMIGEKAQVLANYAGPPGSVGANLLTSCLGVTKNGEVNPADQNALDDSGVCGSPDAPTPIFNSCADFGVECECPQCRYECPACPPPPPCPV